MANIQLSIQLREGAGKGVARKLRAAGRIPGTCYGKGQAPVSVSLDAFSLRRLLERSDAGINTLFDLKVDGGGGLDGRTVLIRELQREPVRGAFVHADLYALDLAETIEISVPIHLTGKAKGVEFGGGILDHSLRDLDLECLPTSIPKEIPVEVSDLDLGDTLHVRDLVLPEGVTLKSDPDLSVVSVVAPKAEEAPAVAEGEVPVEGEAAAEEGKEKPEGAEGEADEKGGS